MPASTMAKAERYRALHLAPGGALAGGCWDPGTARLLAHAGFELLETSSAGVMFARGMPDGDGLASRDIMLENARAIAGAVDLPVAADLENGWGASPEAVAETVRLAGATGIVGGSIEDTTGDRTDPIHPLPLAAERVRAAVEAARGLPFAFALTARADQYMHGRTDLAEIVRRAEAFQAAGADMFMAPGLSEPGDIASLCRAVDIPVAVIVGLGTVRPSRADLAALGVRRVVVGSALARAALAAVLAASREMQQYGTFGFADGLIPFGELNDLFRRLHGATGQC
jgi:2-methylisocitrate lyase-like PEP mutase family enzyme